MTTTYTAYVGCYTRQNKAGGIQIFDVDIKHARLIPRKNGTVPIHNSSYLTLSHSGKFLYSICDEGVTSYLIREDGGLSFLNTASINGMRGCHLALTKADDFIVVSGFHDGKVTVLRVGQDGSVGAITDEVYHNGLGSFSDKSFYPHVECCTFTPDEEYLCACDSGTDQIKIYAFDHKSGRLTPADIIRCQLDSDPRLMKFSPDGRFAYVVCERKNLISSYSYDKKAKTYRFEPLQSIFTVRSKHKDNNAPYDLIFTKNGHYAFCSNAGSNLVTLYKVNVQDGTLSILSSLPISGSFPKFLCLFPDDSHLLSINAEENSITDFTVHYERGTIIMNGDPIKIKSPNNMVMHANITK